MLAPLSITPNSISEWYKSAHAHKLISLLVKPLLNDLIAILRFN